MFEFVRTHQRLMQLILLVVVFVPLVLSGSFSMRSFGGGDEAVATVGKQSISKQDFDLALRRVDPRLLEMPDTKARVLDQLIADRVVQEEANQAHMKPSMDQVWTFIFAQFPDLADRKLSVKDRDAKFEEIARSNQTTVSGFKTQIADFLTNQNVRGGVTNSAFVSKTSAIQFTSALMQERDVEALTLKAADFAANVKVTDEMLKSYFDAHAKQYEVPEHAKVAYVVYSVDAIADRIKPTEEEVKAFYEANKDKEPYAGKAQWHAAHILVTVPKSASDDEKKAAKAKAEQLLADVRKAPADFGKIAKANSDDKGSAENGGDLGSFGDKDMVPEFQNAVAHLKAGEISEPVLSPFGYHIIRLIDVKPAGAKPLEEVRAAMVEALKKTQAEKRFAEGLEIFNDVYNLSDSLQPTVDKLKDKVNLTIVTADSVSRDAAKNGAPDSPLANPEFIKELFADDTIKNKNNTKAVMLTPKSYVAGRVIEYVPVLKRSLDQVKQEVTQAVLKEEALKLAKKAGEEKLKSLAAKDETTGFGKLMTVSRMKAEGLDEKTLSRIMSADAQKLPAFVGNATADGYVVYRVSRVGSNDKPSDVEAMQRAQMQSQYGNLVARREGELYIEMLKKKHQVKILHPELLAASSKDKKVDGDTK